MYVLLTVNRCTFLLLIDGSLIYVCTVDSEQMYVFIVD